MEVGGLVPMDRTEEKIDPTLVPKSTNEGLRPVRFPESFAASLMDPDHEDHKDRTDFIAFLPKGATN
jgi:hypothetical protein